ncbi:uncharacterized protein [Physcomitrium patens]|uniref:uncharacterized protein isoform X3 n=1 Tax=Physcomitrium patens TaxID=3218 RepID=UPI000D151F83|nr:uncharacterized protein LOC112283497 isoform X3 [Physcomitrium patens]|eukprot:XP_024378003.1 uncharacterized protein LOC112283497 isoform X3 [Physcomitrella patens]
MDRAEIDVDTAPQAVAGPWRASVYQPRKRTVKELLLHAQKISEPRPSPVLTDGVRMQGPGVKEECHNCGSSVAEEELQQCSACDRVFHPTCLDPLVNIITPDEYWCCGLCDEHYSRREDAEATDKTSGGSMTRSQDTCNRWNSTASGRKRWGTSIHELKEFVQEKKAGLVDGKLFPAASQSSIDRVTSEGTGEVSRRSKRGRPLKSTGHDLPSKRRGADSRISKAKSDDLNSSSSVLEQAGDAGELAVDSRRDTVRVTRSLSVCLPSNAGATSGEVHEAVPFDVVHTESNDGDLQNVGSIAGPENLDKESQLKGAKWTNSDKDLQLIATKDISTELCSEVALFHGIGMGMTQVVTYGKLDRFLEENSDLRKSFVFANASFASDKPVLEELKLQNVGVDARDRNFSDHWKTSATKVGTILNESSSTLLSCPRNVGDQSLGNLADQEEKVIVFDQQVVRNCSEKGEQNVATTHAGQEPVFGENPLSHPFEFTGKATLSNTLAREIELPLVHSAGPSSSSASLSSSPSLLVKRPISSSPLSNFYPALLDISSASLASPFEGFQSQSRDAMTFTPPLTSSFLKPALERSGSDGKVPLIAKHLLQASSSSPSTFTSSLEPEKIVSKDSSLHSACKAQTFVSPSQSPAIDNPLVTDVDDISVLSNLAIGLTVPPQRARKGSQASPPVLEANRCAAQPARKSEGQTVDLSQSGHTLPSRMGKELNKSSSMRDQGFGNTVIPKQAENGSSTLEADEPLFCKSKESISEGDKDESPSNLLVEDVKVCDTCGNTGYEELLALCSSCNEGAEHTYCMRIQMDGLLEGDWFCEMCQMNHRHNGPKSLERFIATSKSLGHSITLETRPKPVSIQGNSRSRLSDRLNHKKPRLDPVRKSPSKAPVVQMSVKRLASDSLLPSVSRKLPLESSTRATSSTVSPSPTLQTPAPSAKSSLTRDNTFKSVSDTVKVKFLAPLTVANFSSGSRANVSKTPTVISQPPKAVPSGQASNRSRFMSLSSISESSTPSKTTNLNPSHASLAASPTSILPKPSSGKLPADLSIPYGCTMPPIGKEPVPSATIIPGSKLMRLGRNTSSSGLPGEPRPFPVTPRPPFEHGKGIQRLGQGTGGSHAAGAGITPNAMKAGGNDNASSKSEPTTGIGSAVVARVTSELASVLVLPGKDPKPNNSIRSAPRLGNPRPVQCFSCKVVGHTAQECLKSNSLPSEQKALTAVSMSSENRPKPSKIPTFVDVDRSTPSLGEQYENVSLGSASHRLQIPIDPVPAGCSSELEKSIALHPSPTPSDLMPRTPNFKLQDSSLIGSGIPFLFDNISFQQLVSGQTPRGVSAAANRDIPCGAEPKGGIGGCNVTTQDWANHNEGPPGVEVAQTISALQINATPAVTSEGGLVSNSSQVSALKGPTGYTMQPLEAVAKSSVPPGLQTSPAPSFRGHRPHWMVGLPVHAVQGPPPGQVPTCPPSGLVVCGQSAPMPYLATHPSSLLSIHAPPLPSDSSSTPASIPAIPSSAIAWRGAFEVNDGQTTILFDEVRAHVSTKAVAKVYEVASALPQQLRLEQVQRSLDLETWPRQFIQRPPTDGSIALYFFADFGESIDSIHRKLMDNMVARDLVLRAQVNDAELLIFPSNKLSEQFQRWNNHMFLWGVFRAKKKAATAVSVLTSVVKQVPGIETSLSSSSSVPGAAFKSTTVSNVNYSSLGGENTGEIDMEVDMEGGKGCGVSDITVKWPDSANPPSTPFLTRIPANITTTPAVPAATASALQNLALDTEADRIEDLCMPPGFAPILVLPPSPVALETPGLRSNLPPGFGKTEAQKQVDVRSSTDTPEIEELGGLKLKRGVCSVEVLKDPNMHAALPFHAPSLRDNESGQPSSRPSTIKRSHATSCSLSLPKDKERDLGRGRVYDREKERERRDRHLKHGHDRSWERVWEEQRDRERDRDYEKDRNRSPAWDRYRSKERDRARQTDKDRPRGTDRIRERERGRERDRERWGGRERERERGRDRFADCVKDRSHRPRDYDQELDSRTTRYRRSRSRSRSRSSGKGKVRSRSPAGKRKVRSRTPVLLRSRSPSPSRRYLGYRQQSLSSSDSPDSQSLEILQGSATVGSRFCKKGGESLQLKRRSASDKEIDESFRSASRWRARPVNDRRSGSAGASNFKTADKSNTAAISRSVTPVLDMTEGVSEVFSAECAAASTSLPDLNTDTVESGLGFHDFLPAEETEPSRDPEATTPVAEQTFFPGARPATTPPSLARLNFRHVLEPVSARERWGFAVSGTRPEYCTRSSAYQYLHSSRLDSNPDLELALGGRERTPERTVPLALFADGHANNPDLDFALHAKSPNLSAGVPKCPHLQGDSGVGGGVVTASLSLSLAAPQYRKEGNSWVQVEDRGAVVADDVDIALTL